MLSSASLFLLLFLLLLGQGMSPMELMQDPAYRQMYSQMMQNPQMREMTMMMMTNPQFLQEVCPPSPPLVILLLLLLLLLLSSILSGATVESGAFQ